MSAVELARLFVERINAHDPDGLAALLTADHRFIDSLGAESTGRQSLREGWRQYFRMVPDYRVDVVRAFVDESEVVLLGTAGGTYTADGHLDPSNAWSMPAAWRARIRDDLVSEWQVYADNEPIRRCMARASA
jgi:ketosteroid isomerase-like protein